jgi:2-hydroxy-6-oxonona-2,4-dienedioate hydrolase
MNEHSPIIKIDQNDPQVKAFAQAELQLFKYYGLEIKTRYVELKQPNLRVRILEVGSGQPILIAPGGNGEAFIWAPLMAELKGWRFIVFDRPGSGLSDFVDHLKIDFRRVAVDTLLAVLDSSGMKSIPILSNSMGGLWSFWLALDQPERVGKIVQLGSTALILNSNAPFPMRLMSVPIINRRLISVTVPKSLDKALDGLRIMGSSEEKIRALPKEYAETFYASRHLPAFRDSWRSLQERVLTLIGPKSDLRLNEDQLRKVQQPVLFIWGNNDPFGGPDIGKRATGMMPNAELQEIQAGHLPYVDEPAECATIIQKFLSEVQ